MPDFKRPEEVNIDKAKIFAEISIPRPIYNKETGKLVDIYISPVLVETEIKEGEDKPVLPISPDFFTDDKYVKFNKLTYSLGKINRLAESNLDRLQGIIRHYFHNNDFYETVEKFKKCSEYAGFDISGNFTKLSFMQLRNLLSCLLKSDAAFHDIEELNSGEKRNSFTRAYASYVYDRDCYTHGQLFLHYPNFNPILRVKPPNRNEHYISLTEEVLWDNLATYQYIDGVLTKISDMMGNK